MGPGDCYFYVYCVNVHFHRKKIACDVSHEKGLDKLNVARSQNPNWI